MQESPAEQGSPPQRHAPWYQNRALRVWWAAAGTLILLAYSRFFSGTFFSQDDYVWLCYGKFNGNPIAVFWRDTLSGQFFRPVGQLWWALIHSFAGDRILWYQLGFLGVHLTNAMLAAILSRQIVSRKIAPPVFALFALNPIFISQVSHHYLYIFDTLGFCFYLLSLVLLVCGVRRESVPLKAASLPAALAACLCKEAFFTLPAAVTLVLAVERPGETWRLAPVKKQIRWVALHILVLVCALGWRTAIIQRFGGYGFVDTSSSAAVVEHVIERAATFVELAGWSVMPQLEVTLQEKKDKEDFAEFLMSLLLLCGLTWFASRRKKSPGMIWIWGWMVFTWVPSMVMTTYAGVSWYPCAFGSTLLVALAFNKNSVTRNLALGLVLLYSADGFFHYAGREAEAAEVRRQRAALVEMYPDGGRSVPPGRRVFFFDMNIDVFPDAIVKYNIPPGEPMPDVMFFKTRGVVDWILANPDGPGEIGPMRISEIYPDGYMDMGRYRVYPLTYGEEELVEMIETGPPFQFMKWEAGQFRELSGPPQRR